MSISYRSGQPRPPEAAETTTQRWGIRCSTWSSSAFRRAGSVSGAVLGFLPDYETGQQHVMLGMMDNFTVKPD